MNHKRLLMISTDRSIFDPKSAVRARQIEYAKAWDEVHIIVFAKRISELPADYSSDGSKRSGIQIASNCWIYSTGSFSKFLYPIDAISLGRSIISSHQITEITCQDASLTAWSGLSLKKRFHIPLEIQIHEDLGSPYYAYNITNRIRKYLAERQIPRADRIRVVSERIKTYVQALLNKSHVGQNPPAVEVRPIAVDLEWIRQAPIVADLHLKYSQYDRIVLMASRLEKEKNIGLALRAWVEVSKDQPKAGLIIVGKGSQSSWLKSMASRLGLSSSVVFEDWASPETLASYYKTADLFLCTSLFEGYGMALVEAQTAGCPIVSTNVGVAREAGAKIVSSDLESLASEIKAQLSANRRA